MLNIQEAAQLLGVSERKINRWLKQGVIPSRVKAGEPHFLKAELASWAKRVNLPVQDQQATRGQGENTVQAALRRGGVHHDLAGSDTTSILTSAVATMRLPDGLDRDKVLQLLLEREEILSTAMGAGVAIPHPQNPLKLGLQQPILGCCFPAAPVAYKARDGEDVFCLFVLLSCDPATHLKLLSGIAKHLKEETFMTLLKDRPDLDLLLSGLQE